MADPIPAGLRPLDPTPVHTHELPETPQRDRTIPASAWIEAPTHLLEASRSGGGGGGTGASFLRRIGPWLLWRAGPARGDDADYFAIDARDLERRYTFHLDPDGTGRGHGPSGEVHARFRTWKEDLRDHPDTEEEGETEDAGETEEEGE